MQIGSDVYLQGPDTEVNDACPQITGYIMSEARAKLWRVLDRLPESSVYYVDTDSILVDSAGHKYIQSQNGVGDYNGLRVKRIFHGAEIYGPRSIILDGQPRIAGLPKRSVRLDDGSFLGEAWQSVGGALAYGDPESVRITSRSFRVLWNDARRYRDGRGFCVPYRLNEGRMESPLVYETPWRDSAVNSGVPRAIADSQPVGKRRRPEQWTRRQNGLRAKMPQ